MNQRDTQKIWGFSRKYLFNEATRIALALVKIWAFEDSHDRDRKRYDAQSVIANMESDFELSSQSPGESIAAFRNNAIFSIHQYDIRLASGWQKQFFGNRQAGQQVMVHELCDFVDSIHGGRSCITVSASQIQYEREAECSVVCANHRELVYAVLKDIATIAFDIYVDDPTYRFLEESGSFLR